LSILVEKGQRLDKQEVKFSLENATMAQEV